MAGSGPVPPGIVSVQSARLPEGAYVVVALLLLLHVLRRFLPATRGLQALMTCTLLRSYASVTDFRELPDEPTPV